MIAEAAVSFAGFQLVLHHASAQTLRRVVGYKGWVDLCLHGTIITMFLGTSTLGLLQAELAGIMFSLYLRGYAKMFGYEQLRRGKWVRFAGWVDVVRNRGR